MKKSQFKNADADATRKQTFYIFTLTKQDVRKKYLTRWEASQLISALKEVDSLQDRVLVLDDFLEKIEKENREYLNELREKEGKPVVGTVGAVLAHKAKRTSRKKTPKKYDAVKVLEAAKLEGMKALNAKTPTPMVVQQHENPMDDSSPVTKSWYVDGGVCGFAWVVIKCKGKGVKFINGLKKAGIAGGENSHCEISRSSYHKGFMYWVHEGNQSYELKTAYAHAMADYLRDQGIECYSGSRLD